MDVAEEVFRLSQDFPKKEDYGLAFQLRRSALSIAANIAEGYGRNHKSDKVNFYYYARGSITETQSHLDYGRRVGYLPIDAVMILDKRLAVLYNDLNKVIISLKA